MIPFQTENLFQSNSSPSFLLVLKCRVLNPKWWKQNSQPGRIQRRCECEKNQSHQPPHLHPRTSFATKPIATFLPCPSCFQQPYVTREISVAKEIQPDSSKTIPPTRTTNPKLGTAIWHPLNLKSYTPLSLPKPFLDQQLLPETKFLPNLSLRFNQRGLTPPSLRKTLVFRTKTSDHVPRC